jgi:hypothetical protein
MCAWIKVAGNHVREAFGTVPGLFRTVQLNCSLLMSRFIKHSFYGCAPQVVLAVPQEVKLQAAMSHGAGGCRHKDGGRGTQGSARVTRDTDELVADDGG